MCGGDEASVYSLCVLQVPSFLGCIIEGKKNTGVIHLVCVCVCGDCMRIRVQAQKQGFHGDDEQLNRNSESLSFLLTKHNVNKLAHTQRMGRSCPP